MFFIGHDVETLTPPAAPLSLLQSQKGEGAECDGGRAGRGGRMCLRRDEGEGAGFAGGARGPGCNKAGE